MVVPWRDEDRRRFGSLYGNRSTDTNRASSHRRGGRGSWPPGHYRVSVTRLCLSCLSIRRSFLLWPATLTRIAGPTSSLWRRDEDVATTRTHPPYGRYRPRSRTKPRKAFSLSVSLPSEGYQLLGRELAVAEAKVRRRRRRTLRT